MLYHPTKDKVGQPVENEVVKSVVAEIATGVVPEPNVVEYEYKGAMKYAAYYVTERGHCILVISVDEDELMSTVHRVTLTGTCCTVVMVIIASIIGFFFVSKIVNPIAKVTDVVGQLAHMDFSEVDGQEKLTARTDETGQMSRAVMELRRQLVEVISDLREQSERLYESSEVLNGNASETATTVEQVEKAVTEISDGASSQADETQKATENVILMGSMVEETTRQVEELTDNANDMRKSSDEAFETLQNLGRINDQARAAIDVIYEQTNTTNESAMKIREATTLITSIAEETNLLSLNASIEAARAGEAGRGFAVVATQISKLSEDSAQSTKTIEDIIHQLTADSEASVQIMNEVNEIILEQQQKLAQTKEKFGDVSNGIENSRRETGVINDQAEECNRARGKVVDVIQNLSAVSQENAASTEQTNASMEEMNATINLLAEAAGELKEMAQVLEEDVSFFKL